MKLIDKVKIIDIDKIYPYTNNPKEHPEEQINKIASSIKNFGFTVPIIIDEDFEIIAGHGRYKAAKKLELDKIPCIVREDLNEAQVKALRLADNKVTESEWNEELLALELEDLDLQDFDLELTGFENKEIEELFDSELESEEDNFNLEDELDNDNIVSKSGDIIKLGKHRLLCGDSTNEDDVNTLMNGEKADMVFTDPPYGISFKDEKGNEIQNDDLNDEKLQEFNSTWQSLLFKHSKENVFMMVWQSPRKFHLLDMFGEWRFFRLVTMYKSNRISFPHGAWINKTEPCLIFAKGKPAITKEHYLDDCFVYTHDKESHEDSNIGHPTPKPVKMVSEHVMACAFKDDIVLDVFGGGGSTLIACEQLNRICYMMELDEKYCDVIIRRYINYRLDNNKEVNIEVNGEEVDYHKYLVDVV
jgi:DNA modification methylase